MSTDPDDPRGALPGEPPTVHGGGSGQLTPTHPNTPQPGNPAGAATTDGDRRLVLEETCSLHSDSTGMTVASVGPAATLGRPPRTNVPYVFRTIGRFEYRAELGEGGCGIVFLAYDPVLNRPVALKIPRPEALASADMRARFLTEARATAALDHPNIVRVYEASEAGSLCYLVAAYCEGGSLADWVKHRKDPVAPRLAARVVADLASAVQHAHDQGVLHRDLKPSNILLVLPKRLTGTSDLSHRDEFVPLVSDFGLAKLMDQDSSNTMSGAVVGSPSYMSPEQAAGRLSQVGPASDVYGLGAILYELLTLRPPFRGATRDETLRLVQHADLVPPRQIARDVPKDLETICLKCLAKDRAARYATAAELGDDLRAFLAGDRIRAVREPWYRPAVRWTWHRRSAVAGGLVLLSLLACLFAALRPPSAYRRVAIDTMPAGARVVFVPLDRLTGEPLPERAVRPPAGTTTPLRVDLLPGVYFVEAQLAAGRFHQVYRTVPARDDTRFVEPHRRWETRPDGTVELPKINLPDDRVAAAMARFGRVGGATASEDIVPFYLDATEVTVDVYRQLRLPLPVEMKEEPAPNGAPVRYVTFEQATFYAEKLGKRLPTAREYAYAATSGGTRRYPWGDSPAPLGDGPWQFGLVGEPAFDRTDTSPPVYGLYSNVVEWTSTWASSTARSLPIGQASSSEHALLQATAKEALDARVVCGGPIDIAYGRPFAASTAPGPRVWFALARLPNPAAPGLGFRCARSAAPRYLDVPVGR